MCAVEIRVLEVTGGSIEMIEAKQVVRFTRVSHPVAYESQLRSSTISEIRSDISSAHVPTRAYCKHDLIFTSLLTARICCRSFLGVYRFIVIVLLEVEPAASNMSYKNIYFVNHNTGNNMNESICWITQHNVLVSGNVVRKSAYDQRTFHSAFVLISSLCLILCQ